MIATRLLVMEGVWVVGQQNADISDTLQLRDVDMATIFWLSILAPPGEYDWTLCVWQCQWLLDHCTNVIERNDKHAA